MFSNVLYLCIYKALLSALAPFAFNPERKGSSWGQRKMRTDYQRWWWIRLLGEVFSTKREGPIDTKDLDWAIEVRMWGTKRSSPIWIEISAPLVTTQLYIKYGTFCRETFVVNLLSRNYWVHWSVTIHCHWKEETVRERTGQLPSYAEDKKMKSLTLHTHGFPALLFFFFFFFMPVGICFLLFMVATQTA